MINLENNACKPGIDRWLMNDVTECKISECRANTTSDLLWLIGNIHPEHISVAVDFAHYTAAAAARHADTADAAAAAARHADTADAAARHADTADAAAELRAKLVEMLIGVGL
jgi:hypothetical protein